MAWLLILGLAVSSSIDNLGVGMSYGIRKIKISHASNMMIAFICFVFSYIGIYFGKWISAVLPGFLPVLLAAFILSVIGIRIILLAVPRKTARVGASGKKGRFAGLLAKSGGAGCRRFGRNRYIGIHGSRGGRIRKCADQRIKRGVDRAFSRRHFHHCGGRKLSDHMDRSLAWKKSRVTAHRFFSRRTVQHGAERSDYSHHCRQYVALLSCPVHFMKSSK